MTGTELPVCVEGTRRTSTGSPYTDLLPALSPVEYEDLKADISIRGVLVALEFLPDGTLLDGAHRLRAATELGVGYPRTVRSGLNTEAECVAHVLALHAHRRQLSIAAKNALIARLRAEGLSIRAVSAAIGMPKSTVAAHVPGVPIGTGATAIKGLDGKSYPRDRRKPVGPAGAAITVGSASEQNRASKALTSLAADAPVLGRQLTLHRAERLAREARLSAARTDVDDATMPAAIDFRLGDFKDVIADLPDASVGLVLTDPPWTMSAIRDGIFADVAHVSARILKPGGHLAVYTGTQHLPDVLAQLHGVKDLEYRWTIAITNGEGTAGARLPRVSSRWKPVILYRKAGGNAADWLPTDLVHGGGADSKDLHPWQQGVSEAERLIEMLTEPGALVVDPCAGSGTTGVAAHLTGRSWIGAEIDPDSYAIGRSRLAQLEG